MKQVLNKLFAHESLSREEAKDVLIRVAQNEYNPSQIASFVTVFLMRSVTVDELLGFREALLELAIKPDFSEFDAIDLCGTGGDGKNTFNISTLSAFVVAGAGYKVCKHGNYAISSSCGSSNVLEAFGYQFTNDEGQLKRFLAEANICFMHAPLFHPSMKTVAPIRRELGLKTFFNILGPIVNPARVKNQMIGVYNLEVARLYSYVVKEFLDNYTIVHSLDGYDEVSLTSKHKLINKKAEHVYSPEDMGMDTLHQEEIYGAETVEDSVRIFKKIISGEGTEAQSNVVIANASIAIQTISPNLSSEEARAQAAEALFSLKAYNSLKKITR